MHRGRRILGKGVWGFQRQCDLREAISCRVDLGINGDSFDHIAQAWPGQCLGKVCREDRKTISPKLLSSTMLCES
jgi:hypothetical protein